MVPVNFDFFPSNNSQSHTLRAKIEITYSSNIRVRVKRGWGEKENREFILFVHRKQKPRTHVNSGRPSLNINVCTQYTKVFGFSFYAAPR